ncbi:MAG: hypothetical protein AAFY98_11350 [Verrucomicrobiota bacterium]
MKFSDVPNLAKFERFAQHNADQIAVQQAYQMIKERIDPFAYFPEGALRPEEMNTMMMVGDMAARCAAIEEANKIIWACAAALNQIDPDMFPEGTPTFEDALKNFWEMEDLKWMDLTHHHRIKWEKSSRQTLKYIE